MFLSWVCAEIADRQIEPRFHLPIGVLGQTDRAGLGDALQSRGDIDAVAHQVAVALLDDVAQMNADAEFDAALGGRPALRSTMPFCTSIAQRTASTTLRNSMRAPSPVRLTTRPMMHGDGRIDQIAAQRPQPRQRAILVRAGEPAVADHIGGQYRREFSGFAQ